MTIYRLKLLGQYLLDGEQEQSVKDVPLKEPHPAAQAEKKVLEDDRSQTGL